MVLDPNRQGQDPIRFLWRTCRRTGSASATVRAFRQAHVPFPRRVRSGPPQGELVWGDLQHHAVLRRLHKPCDAGACVFGRTRTSKTAAGRTPIAALPREAWPVVVREAQVGYLTWEASDAPVAPLAAHSQAYTPHRLPPPREGPALLPGLGLGGRGGERMTVR
jgi:hypothetical protein